MEASPPELRLLRYFLAVARERSFTRAARRLNMAQPALSQQVALLEQILGCQLFIRHSRGIELTDAGEALMPRADTLLRAADDLVREVHEVSDGDAGVLRVAAVPTAAAALVASAFANFRLRRPRVVLLLQETTTTRAIEAVAEGQADIAIVRGPVSAPSVGSTVLLSEQFVLMVREDASLARSGPVELADLADQFFILFDVDSRMPLHAAVLDACLRAGFSPKIACEGAEIMSIGRLVEAGVGVALLPQTTAHLLRGMRLCRVPIAPPAPVTTLELVWARERPVGAAVQGFRTALEDVVAGMAMTSPPATDGRSTADA